VRWFFGKKKEFLMSVCGKVKIGFVGDGEYELLTGKRYRAHSGKDPGADDDVGIYYFKCFRGNFVKHQVDFGPPGEGAGLGIYFDVADLTGNGLPDILAPGKDGLHLFYNKGGAEEVV
jgi:hypothetical protein